MPNEIFQVAEIPRTLSGKKQELPIKKLLLGQPLEKVVNSDAMANPGCLDWYVDFATPGRSQPSGRASGWREAWRPWREDATTVPRAFR